MRIRAKVRELIEPTNNYIGAIVDDVPVRVERMPDPHWIEISGEDGEFFLFYLDEQFGYAGDSWHPTLESAKTEGRISFGIQEGDWVEVEGEG